MFDLYYFRSEQNPRLHAFTDDRSGTRLPREDGPWRFIRAVSPDDGWTPAGDRSAVDAGVRLNGYAFLDSDGELTFGETPVRPAD